MLTTRRTTFLFPILLACAAPAVACAQSVPSLQDSSVTGYGSTVTINRLPISTSSGGTVFKDVTITLTTTDGQGTLASSAAVTQQLSIQPAKSNIVAGTYYLTSNGYNELSISGPASVGKGGEGEWTIAFVRDGDNGAPCGSPVEFYTGPLSGNPYYARLKAAKITNAEYQYGVVDAGTPCGSPFATGAIIGVSQVQNTLTIASFTNNGQDQSTPVTSYVYGLAQ